MKIRTVKVENPKGYRTIRHMNAGVAANLDAYYRGEELKQINEIVSELVKFTDNLGVMEGLKAANDLVSESGNTDDIKAQIFKKYCEHTFEHKGIPTA